MELKAGGRFRSAVDDTEVIVVKAPAGDVALQCGGHEMLPVGTDQPAGTSIEPGMDTGTQLGKRYADPDLGLEILCTKAGKGTLAIGGKALELAQAKALPSSD